MPLFHPEYGRFALESTPGAPYSNKVTDLLTVEDNMRYRFDKIYPQRRSFLTLVPKTFARPETLGEERDPFDPYHIPPPWGSGAVYQTIFQPN